MKCATCGMPDGNHDRACWQQQLHEQKMRIIKKLAEMRKQYESGGSYAWPAKCTIDAAMEIVREA